MGWEIGNIHDKWELFKHGHGRPYLEGAVFVVQLLRHVQLFATPWTAADQASLFTISQFAQTHVRWCHPAISSSVISFSSCLQSFPASGSFLMSWLLASGGQIIGASSSVLPINIQGWFPLGLTGLISLQSKDSQESSPTPQFESINSFTRWHMSKSGS